MATATTVANLLNDAWLTGGALPSSVVPDQAALVTSMTAAMIGGGPIENEATLTGYQRHTVSGSSFAASSGRIADSDEDFDFGIFDAGQGSQTYSHVVLLNGGNVVGYAEFRGNDNLTTSVTIDTTTTFRRMVAAAGTLRFASSLEPGGAIDVPASSGWVDPTGLLFTDAWDLGAGVPSSDIPPLGGSTTLINTTGSYAQTGIAGVTLPSYGLDANQGITGTTRLLGTSSSLQVSGAAHVRLIGVSHNSGSNRAINWGERTSGTSIEVVASDTQITAQFQWGGGFISRSIALAAGSPFFMDIIVQNDGADGTQLDVYCNGTYSSTATASHNFAGMQDNQIGVNWLIGLGFVWNTSPLAFVGTRSGDITQTIHDNGRALVGL